MKTLSTRHDGHFPVAAPSPAVAGFRPMGLALAIATGFGSGSVVQAQPSGAQVIHGTANIATRGNTTLITTGNGAGTSHSAINWQSFSVPGGTVTRFLQPGADSTSINRVLGNNPSQIFGTLSSNGKLVLVNPWGVTVGAGAVVDTAGFTASALKMSDADALAGRLAFAGGLGSVNVAGHVIARRGDVVLIAPNVEVGAGALVQAPNGATLLAAGQKVALTGRGLEGIQLQLQAPADQAVNLGTLQGDAVGVFAGQLKHSGLIQASAVSSEGGKVVLKGLESADISGRVEAVRGEVGGQLHATAHKVMLRSGAVIDVSGRTGGGEALIGGGWQGQDSRVANATLNVVESGATLRADAIDSGTGGTVVVWSDHTTRFEGAISARGGAAAGDGGQVEVSGKRYLDFRGTADRRAPNGNAGLLLLDPGDITIQAAGFTDAQASGSPDTTFGASGGGSVLTTGALSAALDGGNVQVRTDTFTGSPAGTGKITVADPVLWTTANTLGLLADNGIDLNAGLKSTGGGHVYLHSSAGDITQTAPGAIEANTLVVQADNGSVLLGAADNKVNSVAGWAQDTAAAARSFSFRNAQALEIVSLLTPWTATTSGVNATGSVSLLTTSGNLSVGPGGYTEVNGKGTTLTAAAGDVALGSSGSRIRAGGQTLTITSSTGSITGNATLDSYGGGTVTLNAGQAVSAGWIDVQGSAGAAGGSLGVDAGGDVNLPQINAQGYSDGVVDGTAGGQVSIASTGGNISLNTVMAHGGGGTGSLSGGNGGTVALTALSTAAGKGMVTLSGGSVIYVHGGYGDVTAGHGGLVAIQADKTVAINSIQAHGGQAYGTYSTPGNGGNGGQVSISSASGSISAPSIEAYGAGGLVGGAGGIVAITANDVANGSVTLGTINVDAGFGTGSIGLSPGAGTINVQAGGDISGTPTPISLYASAQGGAGAGGSGGSVQLTSTAGNISVYGIDANGASGKSLGGAGGTVVLTANGTALGKGTVSVSNHIHANGASGPDAGGSGGAVKVLAQGGATLATVNASGGTSYDFAGEVSFPSGTGGNGGTVTLASGGGNVSVDFINANGGYGSLGGAGGQVSVGASSGGVTVYEANAAGGEGSTQAGAGGTIHVSVPDTANGTATLTTLNVNGGYGNGTLSAGGDGGLVIVNAGKNVVESIYSGWITADGGSGNGAAGGHGGSVSITLAGGSVTQQSGIHAKGGSGTTTGGNGGVIAIDSPAGAIDLTYANLFAFGGTGQQGGAGGTISLLAPGATLGSITFSHAGARGGSASGASATGGAGGSVTIHAGKDIVHVVPAAPAPATGLSVAVHASGADGFNGAAGMGGTVLLVADTGSIGLGSAALVVQGGSGTGSSGAGGNGGLVSLAAASGSVFVGGLFANAGSGDAGGQGGTLRLAAGQVISMGQATVAGGYGSSLAGGAGGLLDASAGTDLVNTGGPLSAYGGGSTSLAGGSGGAVLLAATTGNLSVGNVDTDGGSSIQGNGGVGGTVSIAASAGNATVGSAHAQGGFGQQGGLGGGVTVSAAGTVSLASTVSVRGGQGGSLAGGAGGLVRISSDGHIVQTGDSIYADGGSSSTANGGNAGGVSLVAGSGDISLAFGVMAAGGSSNGGGQGGNGGTITVHKTTGALDLSSADLHAHGGYSTAGTGGTGGSISVGAAAGALTIGFADAGGGDGAQGGNGGAVTLTALHATSGSITFGGIHAGGGWYKGSMGTGGSGGTVTLTAATDIVHQPPVITAPAFGPSTGIYASGADGFGTGGAGGAGGTVSLAVSSGSVNLAGGAIYAYGGWSDSAGGGNGGSVAIRKASGDLVASGLFLDVAGGDSTSGTDGSGGAIVLRANAGSLLLQSTNDFHAHGGGVGSPGTITITGSSGALVSTGAMNQFAGLWSNPAGHTLTVQGGIGGSLDATLKNFGTLTLASGAAVTPASVINMSGASMGLAAGSASANLTENAGMLSVGGLLAVGDCDCWTFKNTGTVTGTGTLDIAGGTGTLLNQGRIAPGAAPATVGSLSILGDLVNGPGSVLAIDVASATSYDIVNVSGNVSFTSGAAAAKARMTVVPPEIALNFLGGASLPAGSSFTPIIAGSYVTSELPVVTGGDYSVSASPNFTLTAGTPAPTTAPPPEPTTAPPPPAPPAPPPEPEPTTAPPPPAPPAPPPEPEPTTAPPPPAPSVPPAPPPEPEPTIAPVPAPQPNPAVSQVVQRILDIVPEAPPSLVIAVVKQQENTLTTFVTLLVQEEQRQEEQARDEAGFSDRVVNETTCKP